MIGIIFSTTGIIDSCKGCSEVQTGEEVKIELDGTNQFWPTHVVGVVYETERTADGRIYKIKIDEDDLNGGPIPHACNMVISCYSELDKCKDEIINGDSVLLDAILAHVIANLP